MNEHNHDQNKEHLSEHGHPHNEDVLEHDGEKHAAHADDDHGGGDHGAGGGHGHTHGTIDPSIAATDRGLWAVKWSFAILFLTTVIQVVIFYFSGSIALLADAIHNVGDAATAVPLGIAFILGKRKPSKRFTYGFGRVEDLAGLAVVMTILASAIWAGYESINRFFHPKPVTYLWAVVIGGIVGFLGNEGVAIFRIKVGKEMGSAALVADGYHARTDGFASLFVAQSSRGSIVRRNLCDGEHSGFQRRNRRSLESRTFYYNHRRRHWIRPRGGSCPSRISR